MSEETPKKCAVRRCLGCLQSDDKCRLIRFVVENGALKLDRKQSFQGRGAYLHSRFECYEKCQSTKRWEKALCLPAGSLKLKDLQRVLGDAFATPTTQKKIRL